MKQPFDYRESTRAYYNANAREFCKRTVAADMSELYIPFLRMVPAGGKILDAGCGSGRDSLAFLRRGYSVLSIDSSLEMVKATSALTSQPASLMSFEEIEFDDEFHGIWACASLLHVSRLDLPGVLARLIQALHLEGVLYLSFKHGTAEHFVQDRFFNDMTPSLLRSYLEHIKQLAVVSTWLSNDVTSQVNGVQAWTNAIVQRKY